MMMSANFMRFGLRHLAFQGMLLRQWSDVAVEAYVDEYQYDDDDVVDYDHHGHHDGDDDYDSDDEDCEQSKQKKEWCDRMTTHYSDGPVDEGHIPDCTQNTDPTYDLEKECPVQCGLCPVDKTIGGVDADRWEAPFAAQVMGACGGTIVAEQWIITAYHCFEQREYSAGWTFRPDLSTTFDNGSPGRVYQSADLRHMEYMYIQVNKYSGLRDTSGPRIRMKRAFVIDRSDSYVHGPHQFRDIALVQLATPVQLMQHKVEIADIATKHEPNDPGLLLKLYGWGLTDNYQGATPGNLMPADVLQKTTVETHRHNIGNYEDVLMTKKGYRLETGELVRHDSCRGDSGGPLGWHWTDGGFCLFAIMFQGPSCEHDSQYWADGNSAKDPYPEFMMVAPYQKVFARIMNAHR